MSNSEPHVFPESPGLTGPDFLDKLIVETRTEHSDKLAKAGGKVDDPAIEYADLLLRHYHHALVQKLIDAGINL